MSRIGVLHLVDSLALGGTERVAVNLANALPRDRYAVHLCTTRAEGPLAACLAADVGRLRLQRRRVLEWRALRRLAAFNRASGIRILHAHSSTLFQASLVSLAPPFPAVVWHDHFGRQGMEGERPAWLYRLAASRVQAVVAVTRPLAEWSRRRLGLPAERVFYIPNFVPDEPPQGGARRAPGAPRQQIVCVANLRPQKDHLTLLRAMKRVAARFAGARLALIGARVDPACASAIEAEIARLGLERHVTLLGERGDVPALLELCDVGVLSSASEGMPLSLLEYARAGLPVVATRVGQCAEILDNGRAGLLVPPRDPEALAGAIVGLLESGTRRAELGAAFRRRAEQLYSARAVVEQICRIYQALGCGGSPHVA